MNKSLQVNDLVTFHPDLNFTYWKSRTPIFKVLETSTEERTALKVKVIHPCIRKDIMNNVESFPLMLEFYIDPLEIVKIGNLQ